MAPLPGTDLDSRPGCCQPHGRPLPPPRQGKRCENRRLFGPSRLRTPEPRFILLPLAAPYGPGTGTSPLGHGAAEAGLGLGGASRTPPRGCRTWRRGARPGWPEASAATRGPTRPPGPGPPAAYLGRATPRMLGRACPALGPGAAPGERRRRSCPPPPAQRHPIRPRRPARPGPAGAFPAAAGCERAPAPRPQPSSSRARGVAAASAQPGNPPATAI